MDSILNFFENKIITVYPFPLLNDKRQKYVYNYFHQGPFVIRGKCCCQSHGLPCTPYCWCKGGEECENIISKQSFMVDSDEEDEEKMCGNPFED